MRKNVYVLTADVVVRKKLPYTAVAKPWMWLRPPSLFLFLFCAYISLLPGEKITNDSLSAFAHVCLLLYIAIPNFRTVKRNELTREMGVLCLYNSSLLV